MPERDSPCDRFHTSIVTAAGLLVLALTASPVPGQTDPVPQTQEPAQQTRSGGQDLTSRVGPQQALRQQITRLTSATETADVDEATREQIRGLLAQATSDMDTADDLAKQNTGVRNRLKQLPKAADQLRNPPPRPAENSVESMTVEELEGEIATQELNLTSAEQQLAKDQQEAESATDRKRLLQERVQAAEQNVTSAVARLKTLPETPVTLLDETLRTSSEANRIRAAAEYDLPRTLLAEVDTNLSLNLPSLRVANLQSLIDSRNVRLQELRTKLKKLRTEQARQELDLAIEARSQLASIDNAEIRELGAFRLELAKETSRITQEDEPHWNQILNRRRDDLDRLTDKGDKIRKRVEQFGTHSTLGREILHFGTELPSLSIIRAEIDQIDVLTTGWRLREIEYEEQKERIQSVIRRFGQTAGTAEREILEHVEDLLNQVNESNIRFFSTLADVNGADLATIAFINDWMTFSSEHALWLRSHEALTLQDAATVLPTMRAQGRDIVQSLMTVAANSGRLLWTLIIPAGLAIVILLAVQSRAREALKQRGKEASQRTCTSLQPTMWTLLLSVGLAAEWPLFLMMTGTVLQRNADNVADALGQALIQLGGIALWLEFIRQVLRPGGLASNHLTWSPVVGDHLRLWLRLVFAVLPLPLFMFLLTRNLPEQSDTTERILFMLLLVCSSTLLCRLFFPLNSRFVRTLVSGSGFLDSTRYLWISVTVAAPLILAVCSAAGFHHTALSLWDRMGWSVVTGTGVILCWSLVMRWLRMNHRAMRLELARERARKRNQSDHTSDSSLAQHAVSEDSELMVFGTQARQLVRNVAVLAMIGCAWGIWFDILPALRIVDRYELWSVQEQVTVTQVTESGDEQSTQRWRTRAVTVGSLLLVIFASAATFTGVRQLPGLIEVILRRRSSLDSGVRYTVSTVSRYVVLVAGTTVVCHSLGLRWSQVQWLVAGLSVGLGFGLQEVFANFISGIIILVERPIRIGDIVTIDGVSGVVSGIQIRATSITDWDRREFIVPNRELVTGKLLNWTLSDSTNRVMVAVGIGYGCDPEKARTIMLNTARAHPNVLDEPGPVATFEKFGDSSLELVLRAYLPNLDNRLSTITELHTRIHHSFAEEGIDIPFPQREIRML
ncbi:MAG: mechanosensitive ion channel [Fuerstiella sp.]|nr:mechanosensitive ion channel [Fuerstiella sp.]